MDTLAQCSAAVLAWAGQSEVNPVNGFVRAAVTRMGTEWKQLATGGKPSGWSLAAPSPRPIVC